MAKAIRPGPAAAGAAAAQRDATAAERASGPAANPGQFRPGNSYAFKPGRSGNPAGYSAKRKLTTILAELLDQPLEAAPATEGVPKGVLLMEALIRRGIKGDVRATNTILDRLEGRVPQTVAMAGPPDDGESMTDLRIVVVNTRDEAVALGAGPRSVRESELDGDGDLPL